ncbi:MAG: hypothetical protein WCK17_16000, partial [Verrucomicrobiota bacterium]
EWSQSIGMSGRDRRNAQLLLERHENPNQRAGHEHCRSVRSILGIQYQSVVRARFRQSPDQGNHQSK